MPKKKAPYRRFKGSFLFFGSSRGFVVEQTSKSSRVFLRSQGVDVGIARDRSRRSNTGFTLIELLIVIAIIGIIAALLIPNLLDSLQKSKQKKTMTEMKSIGTMWFSWYTDERASSAAGQAVTSLDWGNYELLPYDDLLDRLTPIYGSNMARRDGWGHLFDFGESQNLEDILPFGVRSPGAHGEFDSDEYTASSFISTDYNQDLVWAGGHFIRKPGALRSD